ncbi:hypothetical protein SAMN02744133_104183 [Thalassospira xiamenensis M-5 = DSM 17429]|uniref:Uncharacterized protein n=1 Tax=Thalassospira xiamenensis M-5 = DSM 17429 TaxID=1123366 RepID=A0AB72UCH3_9PROT|nr:hypothetical protein [Thalassospira xiamenensis]AJD51778.1 hypothetical protein TH3_08300 [Thalassospira xiamenensis M-5 = DSM 17429]SIT00598.1 hypothetical protein SAMN02744133_104183 [Thalassospira xiamenensis M-5 = DSM 17429]
MRDNFLPLAIALGVLGIFSVGWAAGYVASEHNSWMLFSDHPFRLQWEVLLGGATALLGGYLAYRGAVEPSKRAQKRKLQIFQKKVRQSLEVFLILSDPEPSQTQRILQTLELKDSDENMPSNLANKEALKIANNMPLLSDSIFTIELDQIIDQITRDLKFYTMRNVNQINRRKNIIQQLNKLDIYVKRHT